MQGEIQFKYIGEHINKSKYRWLNNRNILIWVEQGMLKYQKAIKVKMGGEML